MLVLLIEERVVSGRFFSSLENTVFVRVSHASTMVRTTARHANVKGHDSWVRKTVGQMDRRQTGKGRKDVFLIKTAPPGGMPVSKAVGR